VTINMNEGELEAIIKHYGAYEQLCIHTEECAELIQAISKIIRCRDDIDKLNACKEHLKEEMADVIVCINQLKIIFDISDEDIELWTTYKIERQIGRMKLGG